MKLFDDIQAYGAQAVLGRQMYYREIRRCNVARAVYAVKRQNMDKDNWAAWAERNPREAELLVNVEKLIAELEDDAG